MAPKQSQISRRRFLQRTVLAATSAVALPAFIPRHVLNDSSSHLFTVAGRRAVIVRKVEVRDATIKSEIHGLPTQVFISLLAKGLPEAQRNDGKFEAAVPTTSIFHGLVTLCVE